MPPNQTNPRPNPSPHPNEKTSPILAEIERLNIPYDLVAQYPLEKLSPARRVQIRGVHIDKKVYAPPATIQRYRAQMSSGVIFPPIVVTADAWIVDGSGRVGAGERLHYAALPAYVLRTQFELADELTQAELVALGSTLNQLNGTPLTNNERRNSALHLLKLGWRSEQIERALGLPRSTVFTIREEEAARKRLEALGISTENDHLKGVSLRAFGRPPGSNLTHHATRLLFALARDAGLTHAEIVALAKEIVVLGSDEATTKFMAQRRLELEERIKGKTLTGKSTPTMAGQLRQHLGFVAKFAGNERALVERSTHLHGQHIEAITTGIGVLQGVLECELAQVGQGHGAA